ncbi:hypothetical protein M918_19940 [Clostridium sp. BL8]|nr:hypothetical protein M918_19940 [Clostridium sp. BL8]
MHLKSLGHQGTFQVKYSVEKAIPLAGWFIGDS